MAEAMATEKPKCGSGPEEGEYDLPLHIAAVCQCPLHHPFAGLTNISHRFRG